MKLERKQLKFLAAGLLCLLAIAWIAFRIASLERAEGDEDPTRLVPPEQLKDARPPLASNAGTSPEVDLLDRVKCSKDAVAGTWGFQERTLITSGIPWGRLQFPCVPPTEYDLRLVVMRKRGTNALHLGLPIGGRQGLVVLDGMEGHTTCLQLGEGYDPAANKTSFNTKLMKWNRRVTILASVRKDAVSLTVEGKKIFEWSGQPQELYLQSGYFVPNPQALFIGSWESIFRVEEAALVPVGGAPTMTR